MGLASVHVYVRQIPFIFSIWGSEIVKIARCARKAPRATRAAAQKPRALCARPLKKTRALRARSNKNPARYARGRASPKSQNPPWLALTVPGAYWPHTL